MTIFLPIRLAQTGGTSTFARNIKAGLAKEGHAVIFSFAHHYDVLLVPAVCPLRYLLHAKLFRRPIIHRLDGVYYPTTVVGRWWRLYNLPLRIIRHFFATATIYQSRYSKKCADRFLGPVRHPSTTIYNGVDTDHFTPTGPAQALHRAPDEKIIITWSRFRRPDQLKPALQAISLYREQFNPTIRFIVIGNFDSPLPDDPRVLLKRWGYDTVPDWLTFAGTVANRDLPSYARGADIFLFTHTNPPCPNNVLEAMACGLPVCGVADGAMPELVQSSKQGQLLATNNEAFTSPRELDAGRLAEQLHTVLKHRSPEENTSRHSLLPDHFSLTAMAKQYHHFISRQWTDRLPAG